MTGAEGRLLREEKGFTLPEMLVTMMIMLVVLFALYSIFNASIRVFTVGNDKVEAIENARLGMERMEREIRGAYPVNGTSATPAYRFFNANGRTNSPSPAQAPPAQMPTSTQITFGNEGDVSGNGIIDCVAATTCEYITYKLTSTASPTSACTVSNAPCTLRRVNAASSTGAGDPVVEFVRPPVVGDNTRYGLRFRYFADTTCAGPVGAEINPLTCTQADIGRVEIALQIDKGGLTQNLVTEVDLRN